MRTTQDDARENQQIKIFGLKARPGRSNKSTPDADLICETFECAVELKTSDIARKSVSTARGVTINKIDEGRKVPIWIFSQYEKPNQLTGEHYVLFPEQMEPLYKKLEDKIQKGTKTLAGLDDWKQARKILTAGKLNKSVLSKLDYAINHKAVALNDPKISWSYVAKNGTKIKTAEELRKVTKRYYEEKGATSESR